MDIPRIFNNSQVAEQKSELRRFVAAVAERNKSN